MIIKLILSPERDWDRKIIGWLENVPRGYRATIIKKELYLAITGSKKEDIQTPTLNTPVVSGEGRKEDGIGQAIAKIVKKSVEN